jgi:RNA polymerase sigma-70 factor (ECF subfamily)
MVAAPRDDLDAALDAARVGTPYGYDALYTAFAGSVSGYLRARRVRDPEAITNEVFLRAFRTLGDFTGDAERFRAWIFTIARHAAIDELRRSARRPVEVSEPAAVEVVGGDVEDDVLARLADDRVANLLEQLSPDQRDVVLLRIVADLSVEQTAAVLDKSYEAVKALQRRALARLRRVISSSKGVPR